MRLSVTYYRPVSGLSNPAPARGWYLTGPRDIIVAGPYATAAEAARALRLHAQGGR